MSDILISLLVVAAVATAEAVLFGTVWLAARALRRLVGGTGVILLPRKVAGWIGMWSTWEQRACPHPEHRQRRISGDERIHGYRSQCMDCGLLRRD